MAVVHLDGTETSLGSRCHHGNGMIDSSTTTPLSAFDFRFGFAESSHAGSAENRRCNPLSIIRSALLQKEAKRNIQHMIRLALAVVLVGAALATGFLQPWNAKFKYLTKDLPDPKYPIHYFPEILFLVISIAGIVVVLQ